MSYEQIAHSVISSGVVLHVLVITVRVLTIVLNKHDYLIEVTSISVQSILKDAQREFLQKGFSGSNTTDMGKEAGVTPTVMHYYFRTIRESVQQCM